MKPNVVSQVAYNPNVTQAVIIKNAQTISLESAVSQKLVKTNSIPSPIGLSSCITILNPLVKVQLQVKGS